MPTKNIKDSERRWYEYYFKLLEVIKGKSKDTSTKVGALIFDDGYNIISTGYNGFSKGVVDNIEICPERYERPTKYLYTEHAERNAIYSCAHNGIPLKGKNIIIEFPPCFDCARGIIQSGIKKVIINKEKTESLWNSPKYSKEELYKSLDMIIETGIEVIEF